MEDYKSVCIYVTEDGRCKLADTKDFKSLAGLNIDVDYFCMIDPDDFDVMCAGFVQDKSVFKKEKV